MEMIRYASFRMSDPSKSAEVRRVVQDRVLALGWKEEDGGKAALVATEMATNLIKHSQQGAINIDTGVDARGPWLRIMAVDHGPGMADVNRCLQDGYSTAGSPGTGLGAIKRLASALDIFSSPGKGTAMMAEVRSTTRDPAPPSAARFDIGGFSVPRSGETQNGDAWDFQETEAGLALLVCDGLGHGASAAEASRKAIEAFRSAAVKDAKVTMGRLHGALRNTRGAAAALAIVNIQSGLLTYCGVGNITGAIVRGTEARHLVSHNGILGHTTGRIAEFTYPWAPGNFLIMHSDGLTGRWRPEEWPGLWVRPPSTIAGVMYRDMERGRDDATVVVARAAA